MKRHHVDMAGDDHRSICNRAPTGIKGAIVEPEAFQFYAARGQACKLCQAALERRYR